MFSGLGLVFRSVTGLPSAYVYAPLWALCYGLTLTVHAPIRQTLVWLYPLPAAMVLSSILSDDPLAALPYVAMFCLSIRCGVVLARILSAEEFATLLWKAALMLGLVGLIGYAIDLPQMRFADGLERSNLLGLPPFNGLFAHKTDAGRAMFTVLAITVVLRPRGWPFLVLFFGFILFMSGSMGAIAFGAASLAIGVSFLVLLPVSVPLTLFVVALVSAAGYLAFPLIPTEGTFGGRDLSNLTGRTDIWQAAFAAIGDRLWLGFGYGLAEESRYFLSRLYQLNDGNYLPPHFHNIFVQALMDGGLVGLGIMVMTIAAMLARLGRLARSSANSGARALLMVLLFLILNGMTEVTFSYNTLGALLIGFVLSRDFRSQSPSRTVRKTNIGARTR